MKNPVTKGSVFDDLGFDPVEAENLKIRAALMLAVEQEIKNRKLTQSKAAALLNVTQPRISDLIRGKIQLFTIDALVSMLTKLNVHVSLVIDNRLAA